MRGRPLKSLTLKKLQGTDRRTKDSDSPRFSPGAKCPASLKGEGRKMWRRLTTELGAQGLLQQVDAAELFAYCNAWNDLLLAREELSARGHMIDRPKYG